MKRTIITQGQKFGRFTVLRELMPEKRSNGWYVRMIECQCSCGRIKTLSLPRLARTASCGCLVSEIMKARNWRHGKCSRVARSKEYRTWKSMKGRCAQGGRYSGMKIDARWDEFSNFLSDMGECPTGKVSIDRIDNSIGYTPSNCRWATSAEQARNRTNNRYIEYRGSMLCLAKLSEACGIPGQVIAGRIRKLKMLPYYATSIPLRDSRLRDKRWIAFFSGQSSMEPERTTTKPRKTK